MLAMAQQHGFHFDTVQMPINVMDAHFRSFTREVMPVAIQQGIAVLAMKTFGDHFILDSKTIEPVEALHYSLTQPVSVVITGIDSMPVLDQALTAVKTFKPMTEQQVASLEAYHQSEEVHDGLIVVKYPIHGYTLHVPPSNFCPPSHASLLHAVLHWYQQEHSTCTNPNCQRILSGWCVSTM